MTNSAINSRNRLLASLVPSDRALLDGFLKPVVLELKKMLEDADEAIETVYFVESGFASVVAGKGVQIEIGLIGYEGMSAVSVVMGDDRSVNQTFVQAAGTGFEMSAQNLRLAMRESPTLRLSLLRYAQAFAVQTGQTALVNGRAKLASRLARWLLMAHDRLDCPTFPFTHQFLALMLGVRRAGVTIALQILEGRGLIKARRGQISIIDRKGLELEANSSYGVPEKQYDRLLGTTKIDSIAMAAGG